MRNKLFRFRIQIGNYPHISFYHAGAAVYQTRDEAEVAAFDFLVNRGYNPNIISRKWIHTNQEIVPRKARRMRHRDCVLANVTLRPARRDLARDTMPVTMCGKKRHTFGIFTGEMIAGEYHRFWNEAAMPYLGM